jgi:glycosyltransferase involved in cell wall biosynthesis
MKLIFVQQTGPTAVNWHRSYAPFHFLHDELSEDYGVELVAGQSLFEPNPYDVLYLPRTLTSEGLEFVRRQKAEGKRFCWSLDDNLWELPPENPAYGRIDPDILDQTLDLADVVCVSTEPLLDIVGRTKGRLCLNLIDAAAYRGIVPAPHENVRVVWAGGETHRADLQILVDVLPRVAKKFPSVEWHFFGLMPEFMEGIGVYHAPVPLADYPRALVSLGGDIGIVPLVDNELNRAKSNIRFLEYSLAGMVTLASLVGPFRCIRQGLDGMLADNWERELTQLIEDWQLRGYLWSQARDRVLSEFSWESPARFSWLELFAQA